MGLLDIVGGGDSPLLRKVAYEPEIIVKSEKYKNFEWLIDEEKWIFSTKFMNSLYVYRLPLIKIASFSLLTLPLPPQFYVKIDKDLQENSFPDVRITFNLADMTQPDGNQSYKKLAAGFSYTCKIIHAVPRTHFTSQTKVVPVSLYLAQTVIHSMMLGNSFNKIFNDVTAMQALEKFEGGMKKRFGSAISFQKLTVPENLSKFKYDNILLKSANDLTIPSVMHTTYKPINNFSYYFFDDFDSDNTPVVGRLRDLSKPLGEKWKIFEDEDKYDISRTLRSKGKIQIADRQEAFKKNFNDASTFVRNNKSEIKMNKNDSKVEVPNLKIQSEKGLIYDAKRKRPTTSNIAQVTSVKQDNYKHLSYYTPDDLDLAKTRNDNFYKFVNDYTESLYKYEVYESHIDAIQLYRQYTLDQTDLKSFFVPINIINIFSRINPHETPVSHTAQFQTIKYPDEKEK
jgi:hypothetical protein